MRSFRRLTMFTLAAVYVLILVGGIVRSSGSGMGCPDWPKCFGRWVPPTDVSELPENYKEIYADYRHKKNIRFAKYLRAMGMTGTAEQLVNDPAILQEAGFNPAKTWIEYVNRLVGVVIGLLIAAVFIVSLRFRKSDPTITLTALGTFILVGFQGWIGSFVVSSNLTPWTITVHMFLALVIVALLVYLVHASSYSVKIPSPINYWWLVACMAVLLVQILLGTQVREAIDEVAQRLTREQWIDNLTKAFVIHRSFSWIVLILHLGLIVNLRKTQGIKVFPLVLILLILATIITGAGMALYAVPPFLQPVHLLLATVTFGMQFLLLLKISPREKTQLAIDE